MRRLESGRKSVFQLVALASAKGEILTLRSNVSLPEHILHREKWIMKSAGDSFRIGSTWERERLDETLNESAKDELLFHAAKILIGGQSFELLEHTSGIRPCTATTRPHLGAHPQYGRIFLFNGFGSKGYALSPYFASHFSAYLEGSADLDSEADLKRHVKKFFKT